MIRFTRRVARQCARQQSRIPDWVVCDTIANGARRRLAGRGPRGGTIILFERDFPTPRAGLAASVRVLGELTRAGCFALKLLLPARHQKNLG